MSSRGIWTSISMYGRAIVAFCRLLRPFCSSCRGLRGDCWRQGHPVSILSGQCLVSQIIIDMFVMNVIAMYSITVHGDTTST